METNNNTCPICSGNMVAHGIGGKCPSCGYAHVPSPLPADYGVMTKKKKITIIVLCVLFLYVIPEIIFQILIRV